jgi:hypothetical protein
MAGAGGGKCKKADRNKITCKIYKDKNQRERNKIVKIKRHLKKQPSDVAAVKHIERLTAVVKGYKEKAG